MSLALKTCSVAQSLDKTFRAMLGDCAPLVISYGINSDALWALDGWSKEQLAGAEKTGLVLIWDGPAASSAYAGRISTAEYINPLTWSLCVSKMFPKLQVVVLDCDAATHKDLQFYRTIQKLDPALRPFHLLNNPSRCVAEYLSLRQSGPAVSAAVAEFLTLKVRAMLTEPGKESDRHALANIVGPLILLGDKRLSGARASQRALRALFREVGLLGASDGSSASTSPPESEGGASTSLPCLFGGVRVRLLLVDDQYDQGWDEWVDTMLRGELSCSIEKTDSPDVLAKAIMDGMGGLTKGSRDCRFRLSFPSLQPLPVDSSKQIVPSQVSVQHEAKQQEVETVLLLDLRLFSHRKPADEAKFVTDHILPRCLSFVTETAGIAPKEKSWLAWPGFSAEEIEAAQKWCANPERETDAHLKVLALLPRLLALADLSVPIVLFSSTGQRRIIELLKPYGSIITGFEKPRFTGMGDADLVAETEARFRAALAKAATLLGARRQCRLVASTAPLEESDRKKQKKYIELYLDESEKDSYFSLGGPFAVYEADDLSAARAKADRFDNWLVEKGVRYFDNRGVGLPGPSPLRSKGANLTAHLVDWDKQPDKPIHMGLVRVRIRVDGVQSQSGPMFDPCIADMRFHRTLKALLELFFCESVCALSGGARPEDVEVSVYAGARVAKISPAKQNDAMLKFGHKRAGGRDLFFSLDSFQVYPIVAEILDTHNRSVMTHRLVGIQMPYDGSKVPLPEYFRCQGCHKLVWVSGKAGKSDGISTPAKPSDANAYLSGQRCFCTGSSNWQPDYRALQYLADEVLSVFPDGVKGRTYDNLFSKNISGEFDETMDADLARSLASGRCLDLEDVVGAVSRFEPPAPFRVKPRASFWLQKRIAASLPAMSGMEFLQTAEDLARLKRK